MGNSTMKSFRIDSARVANLKHLAKVFECSETDIIEQLINYATCRFSDTVELNQPADVITELAFNNFGWDYQKRIYDMYE